MYRIEGHTHPGQCTNPEAVTFTRGQAVAELAAQGWGYDVSQVLWVRGDQVGRLSWIPDYCNPDDTSGSTSPRWFLSHPNVGGRVASTTILPR